MDWISVKDKLPLNGTRIIAFCRFKDQTRYYEKILLFEVINDKCIWTDILFYDYGHLYTTDVTHWMPLPKSPDGS